MNEIAKAMYRRGIPEHCWQGLADYITDGIPPGDFLHAVLTNNLMEAFHRADDINIERIHNYAMFLYNNAPSPCHGSPEKVKAWIARGGLNGKNLPELPRVTTPIRKLDPEAWKL